MRNRLPLLLVTGLLTVQVQAIHFLSTNTYSVAAGETLADEHWIQAIEADINGQANDDLFVMAQLRIALGGTYEQNVWGVGNDIELNGHAKRNVRLLGATIQMNGQADGNLMALGNTIKLGTNAVVGGEMTLLGTSVILEGDIKGDTSITASRSATISGTIAGNVDIIAPEIILQRDARIGGNLTYTASKELVPAQGIVSGELKRALPRSTPAYSIERLTTRLMWFLAALLAGIPFITLFPMSTAMASQLVRTAPIKCFAIGALSFMALPMFGIMSISSLIGVPLGLLLLGGWAFMAYTSHIIMGLVLGSLILRKTATSIGQVLLAMAAGLGIIYAATVVPSIFSLGIWMITVSMGMGALLLSLVQKRRLIIQIPEELKHLEELKKQNSNNNQEEK